MQKRVNLVDLAKSFQTSIYLQNLVSIQPRTSLSKLANNAPKIRIKLGGGPPLRRQKTGENAYMHARRKARLDPGSRRDARRQAKESRERRKDKTTIEVGPDGVETIEVGPEGVPTIEVGPDGVPILRR